MAIQILNQILDPVLTPLLHLVNDPHNPAFALMIGVFIIATIVAFIITIANKLLVDQDRLQFLQSEMKVFQQEMMQAQKSGDPKVMKDAQKKQSEFMEIHDSDFCAYHNCILLDGAESCYNPFLCVITCISLLWVISAGIPHVLPSFGFRAF